MEVFFKGDKMSVLNFENKNYLTGHYPLFLGEPLGFSDEINITYPEIFKIKEKHQSQFWLSTEFSFEDDRLDLQEAPDSERDVMILNLLAQWSLDAMASRSIIELFGPLVSNNELHGWLLVQSFFEDIHAATYSRIIRTAFPDANAVLERGVQNVEIFERCRTIADTFNDLKHKVGLYTSGVKVSDYEMKKAILKGMFALYALEQISFMSSFAATFALAETGRYQGIGTAVAIIKADEQLHAEGDLLVFKAMLRDKDFKEIFDEHKEEFRQVFVAVVKQEHNWSEYIFKEGRKVLGLNETLLKEYVNHMAYPCFKNLGFEWDNTFGSVPDINPLPYMEKYENRDMISAAPQELESNNYRIGQMENDISDDLEFDF